MLIRNWEIEWAATVEWFKNVYRRQEWLLTGARVSAFETLPHDIARPFNNLFHGIRTRSVFIARGRTIKICCASAQYWISDARRFLCHLWRTTSKVEWSDQRIREPPWYSVQPELSLTDTIHRNRATDFLLDRLRLKISSSRCFLHPFAQVTYRDGATVPETGPSYPAVPSVHATTPYTF